MSQFAKQLKEMRIALNLRQKDIAEFLSVTPTAISDYESGKRTPSLEYISNLANRYNINLTWLITGEGDMYNVRARVEPTKKSTIPIDIIPDIAAGTGYDCTLSEPLFTLQVPAMFLPHPAPFYGFRVTGDSMMPDIVAGDIVILTGNWEGIDIDGHICGFRTADGMLLKKLVLDHKKREGWLFSQNQSYRPIRYTKDTPDLVMIGVLALLIRDYLPEK